MFTISMNKKKRFPFKIFDSIVKALVEQEIKKRRKKISVHEFSGFQVRLSEIGIQQISEKISPVAFSLIEK